MSTSWCKIIVESLCCTPENNMMLYINYTSIQKRWGQPGSSQKSCMDLGLDIVKPVKLCRRINGWSWYTHCPPQGELRKGTKPALSLLRESWHLQRRLTREFTEVMGRGIWTPQLLYCAPRTVLPPKLPRGQKIGPPNAVRKRNGSWTMSKHTDHLLYIVPGSSRIQVPSHKVRTAD